MRAAIGEHAFLVSFCKYGSCNLHKKPGPKGSGFIICMTADYLY